MHDRASQSAAWRRVAQHDTLTPFQPFLPRLGMRTCRKKQYNLSTPEGRALISCTQTQVQPGHNSNEGPHYVQRSMEHWRLCTC